MKSSRTLIFARFAAFIVLVLGLSASAMASCADSFVALAAGVASPSRPMQQESQVFASNGVNSSIVGLWHVEFAVGGQTIQEAYQLWNAGGTEVHNPNVDPRSGTVCLGAWKYTAATGVYKLAHRVWNYDTNGNFMGTIHLSEELTLSDGGNTLSGSFKSDFYDPAGKFLTEAAGSVTGKRISVD
jgi:hypothetical protein